MQALDDQAVLYALLDAALDGIIIADTGGRIIRTNPMAAELFGRTLEELTGANITTLMPDAIAQAHQGYMDHHLQTGEQQVLGMRRPVEGQRADGSTFPVQVALGKAQIEGQAVFVATLHDLSLRRAAEEAAARSQRMDAIGRMTGGIAHDFRNLLTVVIGNLELLDPALPPEKIEERIADALAAAELGADLTSRLVGFSRKQPMKAEQIDLNEGVETAMGLLKHTLSSRCTVEYVAGSDLWPVEIDPSQLQTAILNLALNSQQAMPDGGRIFIETRNIEIDDSYMAQELDVAQGKYVRLSVSDGGEGMSDENRAIALEPFFTTKPPGQGTGLGLSMVYGFVKQSGGHVTLYSEPGQGTTVALYFPVANQRAGTETAELAMLARPSTAGKTILVVEDDDRLRRLSEARLNALGFRCHTAPNADQGWVMLQELADIDLVFTDMVMPGTMSGYDLAERIATQRPSLPVLITSGFSETLLKEGTVPRGMAVLRKPYRQSDLAEAVFAALA